MGYVPEGNLLPLYNNAQPGIEASSSSLRDAVQAMSLTVNENYDFTTGLINAGTLSRLGVVNVLDYGAKGDGITNDSAAFRTAIDYCVSNNLVLQVPPGIFMVDSQTLRIYIAAGKSCIIRGSGRNSIIKRIDKSITANHQQMIRFFAQEGDIESIDISNLSFDGNARGNPLPDGAGNYHWEHCAVMRISGSLSGQIKNVRLDNLWFTDPVADNIWFAGEDDCYIDHAIVTNIYAENRNRVRSDITITGGMVSCNVSNIVVTSFEVELNQPYRGDSPFVLNMVNVESGFFDVEGRNMFLSGSNINTRRFLIQRGTYRFENSTFILDSLSVERRINYGDTVFSGCTFIYSVGPENEISDLSTYYEMDLRFINCKFVIDSPDPDFTVNPSSRGRAIYTRTYANQKVTVIDCVFDPRFRTSVYSDRTGYLNLKDNIYGGKDNAIRLASQTSLPCKAIIEGGNWDNVQGAFLQIAVGVDGLELQLIDIATDVFGFLGVTPVTTIIPKVNSRIIYTNGTPSGGGFRGDTARRREPLHGQAYEWVATTTSTNNALWRMSKQAGIASGPTANRPVPNATDIGLQYLDTTLGYLIFWNGSSWRDYSGNSV